MTHSTRRMALCFAMLWSSSEAYAAHIDFTHFRPGILTASSTQPIVLEVAVGTGVASVVLEPAPVGFPAMPNRPLVDNGSGGDRVAGDRIFSLALDPAELRDWYAAFGAAQRARALRIGRVHARNSAGADLLVATMNVPVKSDAVPEVPLTSIGTGMQFSPSVVNIAMPLSFLRTYGLTGPDDQITRLFYEHFTDAFDFINVVMAGSTFLNRTHDLAQNDVQGIGRPLQPIDPKWGSAARLRGVNAFPNETLFGAQDDCAVGFLHETGHQWINALDGGLASPAGLGHWPLSDLAGGIMGFSRPATQAASGLTVPTGGGLAFTSFAECPRFLPTELYLMGLRFLDGDTSHLVAVNQDQEVGSFIAGPFTTVTASDIVAANGPRSPAFPRSPRRFRVATVVVTPDGLAPPDLMDWFESAATSFHAYFAHATNGVGTMETDVRPFRQGYPTTAVIVDRVMNAASLQSGRIAEGEVILIRGSRLGPDTPVIATLAPGVAAPTELGGVRVIIRETPASLLRVSSTEVVAIVPYVGRRPGTVNLQIERTTAAGTQLSNVVSVETASVAPAFLTSAGRGTLQVQAFNADGSVNSTSNPAATGSVVRVRLNGFGSTSPALLDGELASDRPPALVNAVQIVVGSRTATVVSATAAPGVANTAEVTFVVPTGTSLGPLATLTQRQIFAVINGVATQEGATLAVQ